MSLLEPAQVETNPNFVGRAKELSRLHQIGASEQASIVVMYGRRRVGKTELLEQAFRNRNILKFEGVQGADEPQQMQFVMQQLAEYAAEPLLRQVNVSNWLDVFRHIYQYIQTGEWTLYFEELQWLAAYKDNFISQLKLTWDNAFRQNPNLVLILCGSSPSFMINNVVHSKALYNRSQHEFALKELNLIEAKQLLDKFSSRDVMDAYLIVGGIAEYLLRLKSKSSVLLSLCQESFLPNSYFAKEYERIFVSSMADHTEYKKAIDYLSKRKYASRDEIIKHVKLSSGGAASSLLKDLELCGFIKRYTPYNLNDNSLLARYSISDAYLQFYFKFIAPQQSAIAEERYTDNPLGALKTETLHKWLGFSFERFCLKHSHIIAKILGFSAVTYKAGVFFNRATNKENSGYQIDLLFDRDDNVITVCEIKYLQTKASTKVIAECERKLELFANKESKTIHKVLIATAGADDNVINRGYFDNIITLDDIFDTHYW